MYAVISRLNGNKLLEKRSVAQQSRYLVSLAFAVLIILMGMLVFLGQHYIQEVNEDLQAVVKTHNVKLDLVKNMRRAARERTVCLFRMVLMDDPFLRDEEWMKFNSLGAEFAEFRNRLLGMNLSEQENALLITQGKLTGQTRQWQNKVAELTLENRLHTANQYLQAKVMPQQERVFIQLGHLLKLQEIAANTASQKAADALTQAKQSSYLLGGSALFLGLFIAIITVRRTTQYEQQLFCEKVQAQITLHSIADGVITTDTEGRIRYINPEAEELTEWRNSDAAGCSLQEVFTLVNEVDYLPAPNPLQQTLRGKHIYSSQGNLLLLSRSGKEHAIEYTASPIFDLSGELSGTVLVFHDQTPLRTLSQQLNYQATHDPLTGLINRREYESRLKQAITDARCENTQHAICYLDLDQFKIINDTSGHLAGDELLKQLARKLRLQLDEGDTLARLGGDEFATLHFNCPSKKALEKAEQFRNTIHEHGFSWEERSYDVSASIGVVPINAESGTIYESLSQADAACYVAKDQGRNRVYLYQDDDKAVTLHNGEMHWVHRLNSALEENRLVLFAQEIRPLGKTHDALSHYEILVRLLRDDYQTIPPISFIPAAERYGMMPSIDRWVLKTALRQIETFTLQSHGKLPVFTINLSGQSFCDEKFAAYLIDLLKQSSVNPDHIVFEITETAAISNLKCATQLMHSLKALGYRFALDDFGSGLSSFAYLKNLPVDYLKIDGSFIRDICDDAMDRLLVKSMIQMGQMLDMEVIAEYVENNETLTILKEFGVNYVQGNLINEAQPLTKVFPGNNNFAIA